MFEYDPPSGENSTVACGFAYSPARGQLPTPIPHTAESTQSKETNVHPDAQLHHTRLHHTRLHHARPHPTPETCDQRTSHTPPRTMPQKRRIRYLNLRKEPRSVCAHDREKVYLACSRFLLCSAHGPRPAQGTTCGAGQTQHSAPESGERSVRLPP